jgi:hypothetical protein
MPEESATWYVRSKGKVRGPFTHGQLELMRNRGQLAQFDELSQDRRSWTSAGRVGTLFGQAQAGGGASGSDPSMNVAGAAQSTEGWYCNTPTGMLGPVAIGQVVGLLHARRLNANSLVWRAGFPAWVALRDVPELSCHLSLAQRAAIDSRAGPTPAGGASRADSLTSSHRASWFLTAVVAFSVLAAAIGVAALVLSNPKKAQQALAGGLDQREQAASGKPGSASAALDLNLMRDAVGIVVSGLTVRDRDTGESWVIPCKKATCFAIGKNGGMLTNKKLVADHIKLQGADAKIEEARIKHQLEITPTLWLYIHGEEHEIESAEVDKKFDFGLLKIKHQGPCFSLAPAHEVDHLQGAAIRALGYREAEIRPLSIDVALEKPPQKPKDDLAGVRDESKSNFHIEPGTVTKPRCAEVDTGSEYIQHTASSKGLTGGPLVLDNGSVIGINVPDALAEPGDSEHSAQKFYALSLIPAREELAKIGP